MSGTFGTGGDEPYGAMLGGEGEGPLVLRRFDGADPGVSIDAASWMQTATQADVSVLDGASSPLLDIGCGPGRMVRAAAGRSVAALGIDVSADAVALTGADGTPVLKRSVFDRLPLEGTWGTILLMDGNIGIGGDPLTLLRRCAELLSESGAVVVEVDPQTDLDETAVFVTVDDRGNESGPFPWSRIGTDALEALLDPAGLVVERRWEANGRYFVRARRRDTSTSTRAAAPSAAQTAPKPSA